MTDTIYLLMKHPPYPYNAQHHLKAGEIVRSSYDRTELQAIADEKNSRRPIYRWAVRAVRVKRS
jgi:hypothetical protein